MTHFAPGDRDSDKDIKSQQEILFREQVVQVLLDSLGGYLVILNNQRQLLAANQEFLESLQLCSSDQVAGLRLGEVLRCTNLGDAPEGCGTSLKCRNCGAILAMLATLRTGEPAEQECHLSFCRKGYQESREFKVKTSSLELRGQRVVVFVFQDISDAKRREVLEQIFFHDIRNLLGGLSGWSQLIAQDKSESLAEKLVTVSKMIAREIDGQEMLTQAETGELKLQTERVSAGTLMDDLKDVFHEHPAASGKKLVLSKPEPDFSFSVDRRILMRVLINMVKNSLEAVFPGETVSVSASGGSSSPIFAVYNPGFIPPEIQTRVFERTFTTKGARGRGLGTYSMKILGEGVLGGRVDFRSEEARGTKFWIQFPEAGTATP